MVRNESMTGHRARLRERFLANPAALSEDELIELLLTYAVPRQDVAPQARSLTAQFGCLDGVLAASVEDLVSVSGIGEHSAVLVKLVGQLTKLASGQVQQAPAPAQQPTLFEVEPALGPLFDDTAEPAEPAMRTFANDEIANALTFIPQAAQFESYEAFKAYLQERLPYNSESTRLRRANYILNRFFPLGRIDVPLTYFAARATTQEDLKPVLFYHVLQAEPLARAVAEELIWPALPVGRVEREDTREFILLHLPDIGAKSQRNALRSLFVSYDLLSVGAQDGTTLRFQVHRGTFEAFLYILTAEFPEPGMYRFEELEDGPMRHWLLWDREWIRQQLYNLRDLGILSKVSQIDALRQFTVQDDQWTALRRFFEHPERGNLALREQPEGGSEV